MVHFRGLSLVILVSGVLFDYLKVLVSARAGELDAFVLVCSRRVCLWLIHLFIQLSIQRYLLWSIISRPCNWILRFLINFFRLLWQWILNPLRFLLIFSFWYLISFWQWRVRIWYSFRLILFLLWFKWCRVNNWLRISLISFHRRNDLVWVHEIELRVARVVLNSSLGYLFELLWDNFVVLGLEHLKISSFQNFVIVDHRHQGAFYRVFRVWLYGHVCVFRQQKLDSRIFVNVDFLKNAILDAFKESRVAELVLEVYFAALGQ